MSFECHCELCEPSPVGWADELTVQHVEEHGWSVQGVLAEDGQPGWAYSVGLWHTARLPELCIFGLPFSVQGHAINAVGRQARDGARLDDRSPIEGVLDPGPLMLRPVHPSWLGTSMFASAIRFYGQPLRFRQLVWPDSEGRFPWEAGHSPDPGPQPMLWLDRADHPDGPWTRLDEVRRWPFPDDHPDRGALCTQALLAGTTALAGVRHWPDGTWEFLDGEVMGFDQFAVAPLGHLVETLPGVARFSGLPCGQQMWLDGERWVTTRLRARRERAG
jgi:hypothetical protein